MPEFNGFHVSRDPNLISCLRDPAPGCTQYTSERFIAYSRDIIILGESKGSARPSQGGGSTGHVIRAHQRPVRMLWNDSEYFHPASVSWRLYHLQGRTKHNSHY